MTALDIFLCVELTFNHDLRSDAGVISARDPGRY